MILLFAVPLRLLSWSWLCCFDVCLSAALQFEPLHIIITTVIATTTTMITVCGRCSTAHSLCSTSRSVSKGALHSCSAGYANVHRGLSDFLLRLRLEGSCKSCSPSWVDRICNTHSPRAYGHLILVLGNSLFYLFEGEGHTAAGLTTS